MEDNLFDKYKEGFQFPGGRYVLKKISETQVVVKVGTGAYVLCDDRYGEGFGFISTGRFLTLDEVCAMDEFN